MKRLLVGCVSALVLSLAFAAWLTTSAAATAGTLYLYTDTTLTEDHYGSVLVMENGVTLDCDGFRIIGSGGASGVVATSKSNVTIKNCQISNTTTGIYAYSAPGFEARDNEVIESNVGTLIHSSPYSLVDSNTYRNNGMGIQVAGAVTASVITHNKMSDCTTGMSMNGASEFKVDSNTMMGNSIGVLVLYSEDGVFSNNTSSKNNWGFTIQNSTSINVFDNTMNHNVLFGIDTSGSTLLTMEENTTNHNGLVGMYMDSNTSESFIEANTSNHNTNYGLWVHSSASQNTFSHNVGMHNGIWDAKNDSPLYTNTWSDNHFGTTSGL